MSYVTAEEKIIINEKEFDLLSRPLDSFLKLQDENLRLVATNSTCWRGYVGTWEILNGMLYLVDITMKYKPEDEEKLIPLLQLDKAIFRAYWYTGELRVGLVEPTYYHSSYKPVYTKELVINVENGKVLSQMTIENEVPDIEEEDIAF